MKFIVLLGSLILFILLTALEIACISIGVWFVDMGVESVQFGFENTVTIAAGILLICAVIRGFQSN